MASHFGIGDLVQTPFGKGSVRELRNNGRVLVDVRGLAMVFPQHDISPANERKPRSPARERHLHQHPEAPLSSGKSVHTPSEIDLHGLTVEQALARAEAALNDALLADLPELRFIHGRSGGRIRDALRRWLGGIGTVRSFRIDPRNEGVTIVKL